VLGSSYVGSEVLSRVFFSSKVASQQCTTFFVSCAQLLIFLSYILQVPDRVLIQGSFVRVALVGVMAYGFLATKLKGGTASHGPTKGD
jgi:hypothetical protein